MRYRIFGMSPGELIGLEVGGCLGIWKKMENNRTTGEPTQGLKPLGKAKRYWRHLYSKRREDLVSIRTAQQGEKREAPSMASAPG